ncbi:MAG: hypothetical protein FWB71_03410 [Defluviitaleaceae bacterium]|nr:hypothetical protein [Defluviitaleaceae bacterium]
MAEMDLTIRLEQDLVQDAQNLFNRLGVDIEYAIRHFLAHSLWADGFPFPTVDFNDFYHSPEAMEALAESERISKDPNWPSYSTMEELFASLDSEDDDDGA